MINDINADSLRSISVPERTPFKMWKIKKGYLEYLFKNSDAYKNEFFNKDRQSLPKIYWHDGKVDIVRYKTLIKYKNVFGKKIKYILSKSKYLIDIDDKKDLEMLNILIKKKLIKLDDN